MVLLEVFLCLAFIGVTGWLVLKKYNPSTILFVMGMLMLALATILGISDPTSGVETTGSKFMDLFKIVETRFGKSFVSFGLLIMTISGYVAVMNKMKATEAMVYIASKPLSIFKGNPYLAAIIVIPICTCLFMESSAPYRHVLCLSALQTVP